MAWTTPKTDFVSGNILTAAQMNAIGEDLTVLRGDFDLFRRTAGNITLTGTTTWSDLTTIGTTADLTLNASTGDVVEAGVFALFGVDNVAACLDVITVVGSTKTNSLTTGGAVPANFTAFSGSGWYSVGGSFESLTGSLFYVLQSGDISSSTVKLRVQYAMASATNRLIHGSSANPFLFYARNHGPVQS